MHFNTQNCVCIVCIGVCVCAGNTPISVRNLSAHKLAARKQSRTCCAKCATSVRMAPNAHGLTATKLFATAKKDYYTTTMTAARDEESHFLL